MDIEGYTILYPFALLSFPNIDIPMTSSQGRFIDCRNQVTNYLYRPLYLPSMTRKDEMREYESYLKAKSISTNYRENSLRYLGNLKTVFKGDSFSDLTQVDLANWFAELRENGFSGKGLAETSLKTVASYVKAFLRWLNDGQTPPCLRGMSIGKTRSRVRSKEDLLTPEELDRLLRVLGPQKRAIIHLLRATGARPSEIIQLKTEDVAWKTHNGREYVELTFRESKTGEPRSVPVAEPKALQALRDYLGMAPSEGYLFPSPSRKGKPLTERSLWAVMNRTARRIGLEKRIYPYLLRHTRATELATAPRAYADRLMGWKSGVMWKNYTHLATDDLRDFVIADVGEGEELSIEGARELIDTLVLKAVSDPDFAKKLRSVLKQSSV